MTRWRASSAALALIVLLGAALRLFPIWFGLPYPHARPDETTTLGHAVAILAGDPNPHFFNWPSLTFYFFAGLFAIASAVRTLTPVDHVLIARAAVALAGTATIVVLARLAGRIGGGTAGLLAACFLSVATLHVRDSHFALTDVLMTLLVTGSLALLVEAQETSSIRHVAFAGLLGGLATSTKYNAAAIVAAMAGVQWLWPRRLADPRPALAFIAALVGGFLVATPFALLDARTFLTDVLFESRHLAGGHGVALGRGWTYHLTRTLPYGLGFGIFLAGIAGWVPLARHHPRPALVLGAFAAAFFAAIGSGQTVFFRYVMPLVPVFCLSAAVGVIHTGAWLAARARLPRPAVVGLLAAIVAGPSLLNSIRLDLLLARTDTRVLAARWLAPRLHPDDTLHDAGGDYARLPLEGAEFHGWRYDSATRSFGDPTGRTPDWIVLDESPLPAYSSVDAALLSLVEREYVMVHEVLGTRGVTAAAVYDQQDAFFLPVSGFAGVQRPGPDVRIYRRRDLEVTRSRR
jgi:4-amino-4-deoxy-L-arabinose transferase-like glycosyltransferase